MSDIELGIVLELGLIIFMIIVFTVSSYCARPVKEKCKKKKK